MVIVSDVANRRCLQAAAIRKASRLLLDSGNDENTRQADIRRVVPVVTIIVITLALAFKLGGN